MKKFGQFICKNKIIVLIISIILFVLSIIGMSLTKINYDILVYLPEDIETIKGQNTLTEDFNMGAYSIVVTENLNSKKLLDLQNKIRQIDNVVNVMSIYDAIGNTIPLEMLPNNITSKLHKDNQDIFIITFEESTSSESTIEAVKEIRKIADDNVLLGGMSSMVLDTMELSNKEIFIYIIIAVILCILVLELSLDSYVVPILLLLNIGLAILYNLGSNIFLGQISYITKALVAVLQLGVTTDFSIFLYHSYENKKKTKKNHEEAMSEAISETFSSVTGSSLTTIAGFLVLCTMQLTLGSDLGIVMAKGVLLGVLSVLTIFPSLILVFDKQITKYKHKILIPNFSGLNKFIVKHNKIIFILFLILLVPAYLCYSKVDVYYKIDKTLPDTLESIKANNILKEKFNIVSPEIIMIDKNIKNENVLNLTKELENTPGIDFVLSYSKIKNLGLTENMLSDDIVKIFENDKYQILLINSLYDIASDELNEQIVVINNIVKKYDKNAIVAGEGPLMKDLIQISDTDFKNVNYSSIACIFIILFFVLKSVSLPFLLIITIEFAIFINMGFSYLNGTTLPFVAPIVLGTIQLGATIDYAILMTNTYLDNRKKGLDKNESILNTLNYCGNSVFVSAMCFFAATFGVGIYSDLEMVGSLCSLISRGALISMAVVICTLPSILVLFDKVIMKTTLKTKEEKMKNKNIKLAIILLMILILPISANAETKEETVYAKLNSDGSVNNIIVNEQLINKSKLKKIDDYSELNDILNINDDSSFSQNKNKITWNADGNDIFYQGTIDKDLPISTLVTYKLNDKASSLKDMLGKKGKVTITIKYINKDKHKVKINGKKETLYTPFIVTTATMLDSKINKNASISNGKVVSTGTKNMLVSISAPGLYDSLKLDEVKSMDKTVIEYETTFFELPSIYSVITPKIIDSNDLKIFDKMDSIYSNVNKLQSNMNTIETSTKKIKKGSNTLKSELKKSLNNLNKKDDSNVLTKGQLEQIEKEAVKQVNKQFTSDYEKSIANKTWKEVKSNLNPNDSTVTKKVTSIVTETVTEYLKSVNEYDDYVNCETGKVMMEKTGSMSEEQMQSCSVIQNDTMLPLVQKLATKAAKETATEVSSYVAEKVSKEVSVNVAKESAQSTASSLAPALSEKIAKQVKDTSINTMADSLNKLYTNIEKLDTGINKLTSGISKFNKQGIKKVSSVVNNDLKKTTKRTEELIKLSNKYQTFTGKNNNFNGNTKFIQVIDSVEVQKTSPLKEVKKKDTSLIDRIKNIFK